MNQKNVAPSPFASRGFFIRMKKSSHISKMTPPASDMIAANKRIFKKPTVNTSSRVCVLTALVFPHPVFHRAKR